MAQCVIHLLEVIKIDSDDGHFRRKRVCMLDGSIKRFDKLTTVGQTCQHIMAGKMRYTRFGFHPVGNIFHRRDP
ncbi:hypothetical protein D3C86_2110320 [compost metagenome]